MTIVTDDKLNGKPRVEGTRIGVYHIVQYRKRGMSVTEIAGDFLLEESDVEQALAYAEKHPEEVGGILSGPHDPK